MHRPNTTQIASLTVIALFIFSFVAVLMAPPAMAGEAFESPDEFEDTIAWVEWDTWGNFSADPSQNPLPAAKSLSITEFRSYTASYMLSPNAGKCSAVIFKEDYILANFRLGTRAYTKYTTGHVRNIKRIEYGIAPMKILTGVDDEGGWELADKTIDYFHKTEKELVSEGPSQAVECHNIITIRENNVTDGMSYATMPTSSNYTLDGKEKFTGYGLQAGGDKSLDDIGDAIAKASSVTFHNIVNSTCEAYVEHNDGEEVIDLMFTTYDDVSGAAMAGKAAGMSMSIIGRFTHRIKVGASKAADFAKSVTGSVYRGASFVAKKATTLVSKTARTAVNALKTGVMIIPKALKGISKMILIPVLLIAAIIGIVLIKSFTK